MTSKCSACNKNEIYAKELCYSCYRKEYQQKPEVRKRQKEYNKEYYKKYQDRFIAYKKKTKYKKIKNILNTFDWLSEDTKEFYLRKYK